MAGIQFDNQTLVSGIGDPTTMYIIVGAIIAIAVLVGIGWFVYNMF